jgi:ubiquinone/menaquinone biosynthesis C-methylase UbiE
MDDFARSTEYPACTLSMPAGGVVDSHTPESPLASAPELPEYMQKTYFWAYVNPRNVRLLDREIVVRTILWQQHRKLQKLAFSEIQPGQSVLQPASVYGSFAPNLAAHVGSSGSLVVVDVTKVQVQSVGRKLKEFSHATVHHANIVDFGKRPFDVVCCYFLLHEIPEDYKFKVVNHLLEKVEPGGKVVFVDYHKPRWWHPLKLITSIVFDTLEPFAKSLWRNEIKSFAHHADQFSWQQETIFAGLFQKVVATRLN